MISLKPRSELHARMAATMSDMRTTAQSAPPPDLPGPVIDWLTQLSLLYGVPFSYLVPDARMLPIESLRFFYIDRNWLDRLIDGAMSIGTGATVDNVFNEQFFEAIYAAVADQQTQLRSQIRKKAGPADATAAGPLGGLLFRSVVVATWPGLEVAGLDADNNPLQILRMDRLSTNVLLVIFNGIPAQVNIIEPSEGLHMGVVDTQTEGTVEVYLRGLGAGSYPAGQQIPNLTAQTQYRPGSFGGVVNIGTLIEQVESNMPQGALTGPLTPGGFAIQIVQAAGLQPFTAGASPCPTEGA